MSEHPIPPTYNNSIKYNSNTITNHTCQPYPKIKLNANTTAINNPVSQHLTATSIDILTNRKKHTFPTANGPSPPANTRPMQYPNGPAQHHKNIETDVKTITITKLNTPDIQKISSPNRNRTTKPTT